MATVSTVGSNPAQSPEWARKYPPLLALGVALLIALAVLPSSLSLPQSKPVETLEYAPVPPDQNAKPLDDANQSALGLGSSSGLSGDGASGEGEGGTPAPGEPKQKKGLGKSPSRYRCVEGRQTEDPLSPPCVAFFDGDNFGATYNGVTGDEIRLLVYVDGGINYINGSGQGTENVAPTDKYYDLFKAPDPEEPEHLIVKGMRGWQRYFNDRYQTYGRRVHFFVYFAGGANPRSPENRRSDAADNYDRVRPFAVLSDATEGAENDYLFNMARKGVLNFGSFGLRDGKFFENYPKLIWGYLPSIEVQVDQYSSYVCTKVANQNSVMAGDELNNRPRKYGMINTSDKNFQNLVNAAAAIKAKIKERCGVDILRTATFPTCCLAQDNSEFTDTETVGETTPTQQAAADMAEFQQEGITTILWPGGINGNYGKSAQAIGYEPEWILMGDGLLDANGPTRLAQNTTAFDGRAVVATPTVFEPAQDQQRCYQAYREADQSLAKTDLGYVCPFYTNLRQFFIGVQVAGPRLGPTSVDKGFRAIPAVPSNNVDVPACFYRPGDYTCVKDGQQEYWDADRTPPGGNQPGCWRSIQGGRRYLGGAWPEGNINAQITGNEPCNAYSSSVRFNAA